VHFRAAGRDRPSHGSNSPDGEGQSIRDAGPTDIGDAAQNQMPGTPQNLVLNPRDALEEPRRREFEAALRNRKEG
jgi:hypothetical protein